MIAHHAYAAPRPQPPPDLVVTVLDLVARSVQVAGGKVDDKPSPLVAAAAVRALAQHGCVSMHVCQGHGVNWSVQRSKMVTTGTWIWRMQLPNALV